MSYLFNNQIDYVAKDVDPINRLRVSTPSTYFEHNNQVYSNPFKWDTSVVGTGTITDGTGSSAGTTTLSTGGTLINAAAIRASRFYIHQPSGKDLWSGQSFNFNGSVTGVAKRVGYFDATHGVFLELNGSTLNIVIRANSVDTRVAQGSWNVDNLNGSGPSGITFNTSAEHDFRVEAFGGTSIRCYLYFNGQFIIVHTFQGTNQSVELSAGSANNTLRTEIVNVTAASATATMLIYGSSVFAEGSPEPIPAFVGSAANGVTTIAVTTRRPILTLQAKTLSVNGVDRNYGQIIPQDVAFYANASVYFEAVYNVTSLTGASFNSVGTTSIANVDVSATALTGGITAYSGYVGAAGGGPFGATVINGSNLFAQFPICYSSLKNSQDTVTIVATSITGSATVACAFNWIEVY